eukprot:scaffold1355_cov268-Pinguiococcus_pyrenoidosus.AAC.91
MVRAQDADVAATHGIKVIQPDAEDLGAHGFLSERRALGEAPCAGLDADLQWPDVDRDEVQVFVMLNFRRVALLALLALRRCGCRTSWVCPASIEAPEQLLRGDDEAGVPAQHLLDLHQRSLRGSRMPKDATQLRLGRPGGVLPNLYRRPHQFMHLVRRTQLVLVQPPGKLGGFLRQGLLAVSQQKRDPEIQPERRVLVRHHPVPEDEHLGKLDVPREHRHCPRHRVQLRRQVIPLQRSRHRWVVVLQQQAEDVYAQLEDPEVRVVVEPQAEASHEALEERVHLVLHRHFHVLHRRYHGRVLRRFTVVAGRRVSRLTHGLGHGAKSPTARSSALLLVVGGLSSAAHHKIQHRRQKLIEPLLVAESLAATEPNQDPLQQLPGRVAPKQLDVRPRPRHIGVKRSLLRKRRQLLVVHRLRTASRAPQEAQPDFAPHLVRQTRAGPLLNEAAYFGGIRTLLAQLSFQLRTHPVVLPPLLLGRLGHTSSSETHLAHGESLWRVCGGAQLETDVFFGTRNKNH